MTNETSVERRTGHCLCEAVRYEINGPIRPVVICHCSQCLRTHGHYAAYTGVPREYVAIDGEDHVAWYRSSEIARRGFCRVCGSRLFWDRDGADYIAIAAGTLDPPTGVHSIAHIFVDDKSDYYELEDSLEQRARGYGERPPD
ncbi:MAG: GFA family protein [Alphaproteobacteria bacterium]|nr:GFA family protein [Alphaproteobacteria bacterium]